MSQTLLSDSAVDRLVSAHRGPVLGPGNPAYDTRRKVYNAMIDRHPRLIACCADAADVMTAVQFGRAHNLQIAVRGGGHSGGGFGVCDDGLVIDLSALKYVRVDPTSRTVRVGGGSTWGDVDHATHPFGLATPAGIISTTGVTGLTLGGGLGHLTRKYGLTIDNLLGVDIVLADGSAVIADFEHHPDLFWAVRGGGGNFGVVTSLLFRAHPVRTVIAGPMLWEIEHAARVMRWYAQFIKTAPEDLNGFFAFLVVPPAPPFPESLHLKNMCAIVWCSTGKADATEELLAQARRVAPVAFEAVGPMPYPAMQSMFDGLYPPGLQWYWRADFVRDLSEAAITRHVEYGARLPTMHSTMHLYPVNGAAARIRNSDTPWAYRDATFAQVIVGVDPDPQNRERITAWCKQYWEAVHPYSAGGAYVNFLMDEGQERVQATYGGNYARLAALKQKYDPDNVFRVNQNIRPTP